jgi:hypothetical protein
MSRLTRLAAVIVPALGLAGLWAMSDHTFRQGTEWEVPIEGYDPRDMLRGHYVEFSYDWPGVSEFRDGPPQMLCLEGNTPRLDRVTSAIDAADGTACAHPVRADTTGVYGWEGLTRGRLYLGQDRAAQLEEELRNRDQRGIVTIRQREDGSFAPISIRFQTLTAQEIADRDAQNERAEEPAPPPAIMSQ